MFVDVNISAGRAERIAIYKGDSLPMVAMEFAKKQGLAAQMQSKLLMLLQSEMAKLRENQAREQQAAQAAAAKAQANEMVASPGLAQDEVVGQDGRDFRRSLRHATKRDRSVFDESLAEQLKAHANQIALNFQPSTGAEVEKDQGEEESDDEEGEESGSEEESDDDDDDDDDDDGEYDESDSEEEEEEEEDGQEEYV